MYERKYIIHEEKVINIDSIASIKMYDKGIKINTIDGYCHHLDYVHLFNKINELSELDKEACAQEIQGKFKSENNEKLLRFLQDEEVEDCTIGS